MKKGNEVSGVELIFYPVKIQEGINRTKAHYVKYELEKLNEIISVSLKPRNLLDQKDKLACFNRCREALCADIERGRKQIIEDIFNSCDEWKNSLYVRHIQIGIISLADELFKHSLLFAEMPVGKLSKGRKMSELYVELYQYLEELLGFLEVNFSQYFDKKLRPPALYQRKIAGKMRQGASLLRSYLRKRNIKEELVNLICQPFNDPALKTGKFSFNELQFRREMQEQLLNAAPRDTAEAINVLIHFNFNSKEFFDFFVTQLSEEARLRKGIREEISYYSLQFKLVNQVQAKPGMALKPSMPPISDQLVVWISEELYFLEKQLKLVEVGPVQCNLTPGGVEKIETSLSVAHLSLGMKLLMDAGVILNQNSTEVMRFVARNMRTGKTETISEGSLRRKAYQFESGTVEGVKEVIIKLLNLVRGY